jgi:sulfite exporter TauE/SafE
MTLASILALGFLIGLRHALEPDHIAAVASLATRESSVGRTLAQGAAWGVGHTVTLALVGGLVLALGTTVPEGFSAILELGVGVMLVLLGTDVLLRVARERVHVLRHRALCVGMVHGMAGSAALVLLALERVESLAQGIAFIAVFGAGSIAGMSVLSIAIGVPLRASAGRLALVNRGLTLAVGLVTCAIGLDIVATRLG